MKDIKLYPHNQETYDKIQELWKTENKVAAVQATGTGKSYLILKCIYNAPDVNKVLLAPSNYILEQIEKEAGETLPNTTTMTYSKLSFMSDDEIKELNVSVIFLDEFHRCGAEQWGDGVQRLLNAFPDAKILGTSATHIRFLDNARNMGEELFNGNIINNLSLAEAIVKKILPMSVYISALYTFDNEIDNLKTKVENSKNDEESKTELLKEIEIMKNKLDKSKGIPNILKKHLSKNYNGKFIIFCKDKIHLDEMKEIVVDWFKQSKVTKQVDVYSVYSNYEYGNVEVEAFINNKNPKSVKLLFSIEMFNEGIHIEDVTGVILLRPTVSPIIYYQQIGRAMQTGKDNSPVIFDFVNNFDNIGAKNFIEDLEKEVDLENEKSGKGEDKNDGEDKKYIDISEFMIFDETLEAMDLFEKIEAELIDNWDKMYEQLKLNINSKKTNRKLIEWASSQRKLYHTKQLKEDRIIKLENINFKWNILNDNWNKCFDLLIKYQKTNGNTLVPETFIEDNENLGNWVKTQRRLFKKGTLLDDRFNKLAKIGFVFDLINYQWDDFFNELFIYMNENHSINIPINYKITDGRNLHAWLISQRILYKKGKLSDDQILKLKEIGFNLNNVKKTWNDWYKIYEQYIKENDITTKILDKELHIWVRYQRNRVNKLSKNKIQRLNNVGFIWDIKKENVSDYHLQNLLKNNNMDFKDFANLLNILPHSPKGWYRNHQNIPKKYIPKIAEIFKIEEHLIQPQKGDGCVK